MYACTCKQVLHFTPIMQQPLLDNNINHWQIRGELSTDLPKEGEVNVGRQGFCLLGEERL